MAGLKYNGLVSREHNDEHIESEYIRKQISKFKRGFKDYRSRLPFVLIRTLK